MRRLKPIAILASMLSAAALAAMAAPAPNASLGLDSSQPIAVNADSFLADLNNETGTYTGNVIDRAGAGRGPLEAAEDDDPADGGVGGEDGGRGGGGGGRGGGEHERRG